MQPAESPHPHARAARLALSFRADLATIELFARLAADGIEGLLLRGPAIAERLYEAGERSYGDTDVLVDETDQQALEAVLTRLDYTTFKPGGEHWRRTRDGAEVDVHDALPGARATHAVLWKRLFAHRSIIGVAATAVPTLDLEATALVVALHAAHHGAAVPHTLVDLERGLSRFDTAVWSGAAVLAGELDGLLAFRQGLSMLPAGTTCLAALGLDPAISVRSSLRRRGIELPYYLSEALSPRERLEILWHRATPTRGEIAATIDERATVSTSRLLVVHAQRVGRLIHQSALLASEGWRAYRETAALRRQN